MFRMWHKFTKKDEKTPIVNREVIERAYKRRSKDIDSLREYDRGEKEIHAPNFRDIISSIRGTV